MYSDAQGAAQGRRTRRLKPCVFIKVFSMHFVPPCSTASFFLTAAGQFIVSFSAFLAIYFLFQRFHAVEVRFEQVLLCYAVVLTAFALSECFFRGFDTFAGVIGNGSLTAFWSARAMRFSR
ncbi:MAG: hypothetical protein ACLSB9_21080 [Hydrogeniiclostridium mannosilyticum]